MTWLKRAALVSLLGFSGLVVGEEDKTQAPDIGDTISGQRPPELDSAVSLTNRDSFEKEIASYEGREYSAIVYYGARVLDLTPEFIHDGRAAVELLYGRDYLEAKKAFAHIAKKHRGYGLGPVGQVLVWQALMIENFDFRYETQYLSSYRQARQELEEAMARPGNEAWEYFLLGGMLGIDSIHTMRHEEYLVALNRGYEAMKAVNKCKALAPEFIDMQLGDGLFNYWRTIIAMSSKLIPDGTDDRKKGIRQMSMVEDRAVFLQGPATLALAFTWIEEGKYREAMKSTMLNRAKYPNNVINNLTLGRVHMYLRQYEDSEKVFEEVVVNVPENMRVHYYMGRLYSRWGKLSKSDGAFDTYLGFSGVNEYDQAVAWYYKGNLAYRKKDWDTAERYYKRSWKLAKLEKAKKKLARVKKRKAEG